MSVSPFVEQQGRVLTTLGSVVLISRSGDTHLLPLTTKETPQ
jgi:hypothetical protein